MEFQHSFPKAEEFLSAYTNLVHVHCAQKQFAAAVLDYSVPTVKRLLTAGHNHWIEADKGAPDILSAPGLVLVLYRKMLQATRDPRSLALSAEEMETLRTGQPSPAPAFVGMGINWSLSGGGQF